MELPPVPISLLQNLRCGHCKKFVTCGPVHVTPDSGLLCGRCLRFAKRQYRNLAFEAAASVYRYPCHYWPKHCNKKLAWNEAFDHERNCLFQSGCNVFCSRPATFFKSDRKYPKNQEISLEHVPDEILPKLKCVSCENYLSNAPVYLVIDGKNVCHRCNHSNGVPKGSIRNLAYETISQSLIFPCIYRYRGCTMRLKFGREMWLHENDCPYGQTRRLSKKPSKIGKEKERGVIETHSGHIWGTITPHSALFAPPKTKNEDGNLVTQEFTEVIKKKNKDEEMRNFEETQSMDSVMSRGTFDSVTDNLSRSLADNISRDNISRSTIDNISRDNVSRASSRAQPEERPRYSNETMIDQAYRPSIAGHPKPRPSSFDVQRQMKIPRPSESTNMAHPYPHPEEVASSPTTPGYNKAFYGYYQENVAKYDRTPQIDPYAYLHYHYPPIYDISNLNQSMSFNYGSGQVSQILPKRSESLRVGNQEIIDELRLRQQKKQKDENPYGQCKNLQEIVQKHDEVFN